MLTELRRNTQVVISYLLAQVESARVLLLAILVALHGLLVSPRQGLVLQHQHWLLHNLHSPVRMYVTTSTYLQLIVTYFRPRSVLRFRRHVTMIFLLVSHAPVRYSNK